MSMGMNFWQLMSIMRGDSAVVSNIAFGRGEWRYIADWITMESQIVDSQDGSKLDHVLPDEFVHAVLAKLRLSFYLNSQDGHLRAHSVSRLNEEKLSPIEAYERFGGEALEDVLEKGSFPIAWLKPD